MTDSGSKVSDAADQNIGTDCYTGNKFKCGAPTGEIYGGDGEGGAGKVLLGKIFNKIDPDDLYGEIQRTASIIGFEVIDPGSGYTQEPLIDFGANFLKLLITKFHFLTKIKIFHCINWY